jgi:hypothetical protein
MDKGLRKHACEEHTLSWLVKLPLAQAFVTAGAAAAAAEAEAVEAVAFAATTTLTGAAAAAAVGDLSDDMAART